MGDWTHSRVLYAVEFSGKSLSVRAMTMRRGSSVYLLMSTGPSSPWNSDLSRWLSGGYDYNAGAWTPAVWPMPGVDPWAACSTWRAIGIGEGGTTGQQARFCGNCGTPRGEGFVFCGECGSRFDTSTPDSDPESTLRALVAQPIDNSHVLARLVGEMGDNTDLTPEARHALNDLIVADFHEITVRGPIDGTASTSKATLTVAAAQDIREAVVQDRVLSVDEMSALTTLMRRAPWTFGYWGTAKAFLKRGPQADHADEWATGVARLSSARAWGREASEEFEPVAFLESFVEVSGTSTLNYMARRTRRDLSVLAANDPDLYARISARILMEWDDDLNAWAFAPAHVMLGGMRELNAGSQGVRVPADMAARADAHPEIWDARLGLVAEVFAAVRRSPEAHTWAYQVLEANNRGPQIAAENIGLSLSSSYPPLFAAACAALPDFPEVFKDLNVSQWQRFFASTDDAVFDRMLDHLTTHPAWPAAVQAAHDTLLARPKAPLERRARLAVLYLAGTSASAGSYYRPGWSQYADIQAVVALGEAYRFDPAEMWRPILMGVEQFALAEALFLLRRGPSNRGHLAPLADALFHKTSQWQMVSLAQRCLQHRETEIASLGWRLIDADGGLDAYLPRLRQWIESGELTADTASALVRAALDRANADQAGEVIIMAVEAPQLSADPGAVARLILECDTPGPTVWAALSMPAADRVWDVATSIPALMSVVGDSVVAGQVASSTDLQIDFLRDYARANPGRIQRDPEFGSALARSVSPSAQEVALRQLEASGHVPKVWLQLAECGMPSCLAVATAFVESQRQPQTLLDAVLACLDSQVASARDIGLRILSERQAILSDPRLWQALAESDEPVIQRMVAEEALARGWSDTPELADFDRRVLSGRRRARAAKESVKSRLATVEPTGVLVVDTQRMQALMDMARGANARDREWALSRIAALSLQGVEFPDINVSATTMGGTR